jgi:hypothetical protein
MTIRLEDGVDPALSRMASPQDILDKTFLIRFRRRKINKPLGEAEKISNCINEAGRF